MARVLRRPSKWVIIVTFVDGESRYYSGPMSEHEWVRTHGSAARYESEMDALYHAYAPKECFHRRNNRIAEVAVEEIENPRKYLY